MTTITPEIEEARAWAKFYAVCGYNPLPSATDRKMPAIRGGYARLRDRGVTSSILESFWRPNIQVACGKAWNLAVIDLDGSEAIRVWDAWCRRNGAPATWTVERDPSAGRHLWFSVPDHLDEIRTQVLWGVRKPEGGWAPGAKVELLGDRSLATAPPSRHVKTGQPYRFVVGPDDLPEPAALPGWLWSMASRPACQRLTALPPVPSRGEAVAPRPHHDKRAVLAAIPEAARVHLAEQFGVRFASRTPNALGWCRCYRDESDRSPSASFNVGSGYWWAAGVGRCSLFELGVRAGAYPDLCAAIDAMGDAFIGTRRRDAS